MIMFSLTTFDFEISQQREIFIYIAYFTDLDLFIEILSLNASSWLDNRILMLSKIKLILIMIYMVKTKPFITNYKCLFCHQSFKQRTSFHEIKEFQCIFMILL